MGLVFLQASRVTSRADEQLARRCVVAVRLRPRKRLARNLLDQSFTQADAGNQEIPDVQIAAERDKCNGRNADDVCAVSPDRVAFHSLSDVSFQNIGQPLAQQGQFQRRKAMQSRPWSDVRQSFRVSSKCHGNLLPQIRPRGQPRLQQRSNVPANLLCLCRPDHAGNIERAHQTYRAHRQLRALLHGVISKNADFQAAAAQVHNAARGRFRPQRSQNGHSAQPRLFGRTDYLESDPCLLLYLPHERVAVPSLAGRTGGHRAVARHSELFHNLAEVAERFDALLEKLFAEAMAQKNAFAQPQRIALIDQRLYIERGIGPGHRQAQGIGARVDGGNVNGLGHFRIYRQRCASAAEGVYFVARIPNCSPIRWRNCLLTAETLASPSSSMNEWRLAINSNSFLIIVW